MENKCRICAKQYLCKKINNKAPAVYDIFKTANELGENCKQIKFTELKNYGEVKYGDRSRRVCKN